jgi:P27 family predicted phage terminase small subunit
VVERGMRGRKPKPIQRQIVEGDPSKHGVHKLEEARDALPQVDKGLPNCPADLGPLARFAWNFWKAELEKMNLAFQPDRMMLAGACVHYQRAKLADSMIDKHGLVVVDAQIDHEGKPTGHKRIRNNPAIAISNASWALVRSYTSEFGLSPIGRQRLEVQRDDNNSREELIALLSQPRTPRTNVQ